MSTDPTRPGRRRLLFLCQNLPFPPDGGALIRSFHTLRLLSELYDVTALCFFRRASQQDAEAVAQGRLGLGAVAHEVEVFPIPQESSRLRLFLDHVRSLLTRRAYTRWTYESGPFRRRLESLLAEGEFEVVHVDSLDLVGYLPALRGARVVVAHHNVESQLLERRSASETGLRARYLGIQARFVEAEERTWSPRVDLNVTVSPEDAALLQRIAPGSRVVVAPNGVDTDAFQPSAAEPQDELVFLGGYAWFPNRDAMEYFADRILPLIHEAIPDLRVTWVGRAPEEVMREMRGRGIEMTGYVDDFRPIVHRAKCFIAPLRVGGGTRLKILDAWSLGKAVVATPEAAEGLIQHHGSNLLLASTEEAFAQAVIEVLRNDDLRKTLEAEGRQTAVETYDWSHIGRTMHEAYAALPD